MNRQFTIQPGRASNMAEVIASLKKRGFYDSGIPRVAAPKKKAAPFRVLSSKQMRYLSPEDLKRYIEDHG